VCVDGTNGTSSASYPLGAWPWWGPVTPAAASVGFCCHSLHTLEGGIPRRVACCGNVRYSSSGCFKPTKFVDRACCVLIGRCLCRRDGVIVSPCVGPQWFSSRGHAIINAIASLGCRVWLLNGGQAQWCDVICCSQGWQDCVTLWCSFTVCLVFHAVCL